MKVLLIRIGLAATLLLQAAIAFAQVERKWFTSVDDQWQSNDQMEACAFDSQGCLILVGAAYNYFITVKLSPLGVPLWTRYYMGPDGNMQGYASGVAVDSGDNIVVCGGGRSSYPLFDYDIVKYAPDGSLLWHVRYDPFNWNDFPIAVGIANGDTVVVTGNSNRSEGPGGNPNYPDIATLTISPNGTSVSASRYGSLGPDTACSMAIGPSGQCVVGGTQWTASGGNVHYELLALPGGTAGYWGGDGYVAVDNTKTVLFGTDSATPNSDSDGLVTVFSGPSSWSRRIQTTDAVGNPLSDDAKCVALDSGGHVIAVTRCWQLNKSYVTKLDTLGNEVWRRDVIGGEEVLTGQADAIYLAGSNPVTGLAFVQKLDSDGNLLWIADELNMSLGDFVRAPDGSLFLAGDAQNDMQAACFEEPPISEYVTPASYSLSRGSVLSGGLSDLSWTDNLRMTLRPGAVFVNTDAPIQLNVEGTTTTSSPTLFQLNVETSGSSGSVLQRVFAYDFSALGWVELDSRQVTISDSAIYLPASADLSRFVEPSTGKVKARVTFKPTAAIFAWPWTAKVDQFCWRIH